MNEKRLWAPWRLEYIHAQRDKKKFAASCPFCDLVKQSPSETNLVLYKDRDLFVVMNKFPYNPGHIMVLPRMHKAFPSDVPKNTWTRVGLAVRQATVVLRKAFDCPGLNLGINLGTAGGAGIPGHLHQHILPRWTGDTNFMPLLAETKNLPSHNLTVYRQLAPHFRDFAKHLDS